MCGGGKGGPEPLQKEIHEILGSKREDRFSDPFLDWVQNTSLFRFVRSHTFYFAPNYVAIFIV